MGIAVVPDNRDPFLLDNPACPFDFWDEMRERQESGWKLAMHGYQHLPHRTCGGVLEREAERFTRFDDAAGMVSSSTANRVAGTLVRRLGVGLASLVGQSD